MCTVVPPCAIAASNAPRIFSTNSVACATSHACSTRFSSCAVSARFSSALSIDTVAIIGSTGSGKSSLINLVPRFYDASAGAVLVDGVDVRDYDLKALRDKIGCACPA